MCDVYEQEGENGSMSEEKGVFIQIGRQFVFLRLFSGLNPLLSCEPGAFSSKKLYIHVYVCMCTQVCVCAQMPIPSFKILCKSCFPVISPDGANLFPSHESG